MGEHYYYVLLLLLFITLDLMCLHKVAVRQSGSVWVSHQQSCSTMGQVSTGMGDCSSAQVTSATS